MLCVAESIAGPYLWGHYDILVLPPSFPFGGMENPNLTFATPTLLVSTAYRCCIRRLCSLHLFIPIGWRQVTSECE